MKKVMLGSLEESTCENKETTVTEAEKADELDGQLKSDGSDDKLMHSVLENDAEKIDDGKLLSDSINNGIGSFTPDIMMNQVVSNYKNAERIYGESIIRAFSGYDPGYVEKNVKIPEFQREIKENIKDKTDELRKEGLIDKDGVPTEKGIELASLSMYAEELDNMEAKGILGDKKT